MFTNVGTCLFHAAVFFISLTRFSLSSTKQSLLFLPLLKWSNLLVPGFIRTTNKTHFDIKKKVFKYKKKKNSRLLARHSCLKRDTSQQHMKRYNTPLATTLYQAGVQFSQQRSKEKHDGLLQIECVQAFTSTHFIHD